jgi:acetyltransferase
MVNEALINPRSILVAGGSNDLTKPGGKILKNIIDGGYKGDLYVLNPHHQTVQNVKNYQQAINLPATIDLAILAIAAPACPPLVDELTRYHQTKAIIVISAGFSELNAEGAQMEQRMRDAVTDAGGCLIGPNCIGVVTPWHTGIFTTPIPKPTPLGADFITASGAVAVFTMEASLKKGIRFNHIFSVGNSAQTSIEDVVEWLDKNFNEQSSRTLLLYFETIKNPLQLLEHAHSLRKKGCTIAAIKAGSSEAGSRAAASHTGAMASNDLFVDALFSKSGIIRCYNREQLENIAAICQHKPIINNKIAIITQAGGPAVMLTDTLSKAGIEIPPMPTEITNFLRPILHIGSSIGNPVDILATGTTNQLSAVIDACETQLEEVGSIAVIYGSAGLFDVQNAFDTIAQKQKECTKPVFAILPSVTNASDAMKHFISNGNICITDEVLFGEALSAIINQPITYNNVSFTNLNINQQINHLLANKHSLSTEEINQLLDFEHIPRVEETMVTTTWQLENMMPHMTFPVVAKARGINHKTDVGGVITNITNADAIHKAFHQLIQINGCNGIIIQPCLQGIELYIGAIRESGYPPLIMCGAGGIYVEILSDIKSALAPISMAEARDMIRSLNVYKLFKGFRGKQPINETLFATLIVNVSTLMLNNANILEMDLNPLIATGDDIYCVDARIRLL